MANATASTYGILRAADARAFTLTRWCPAPDLAEYVERHWMVRWSLRPGASFTQELLPHPCVNLVSAPEGIGAHGMALNRTRHRLEGAGVAIGTKFRPGAFSAFVDVPASRLVDRSFELSALFGEKGKQLQESLTVLTSDAAQHTVCVEGFLRARIPAPDPRRELLRGIVADMLEDHSLLSVAELARRHGLSQRTLQRLFREYVGVPPKWVLKRYRVHEAAERLASCASTDAARLAAELGYFDQPHFVKDFTAQVGCSPRRYAQRCQAAAGAISTQAA